MDDGKGKLKKAPIEAAEKVLGERLDNLEKRKLVQRRRIEPGVGATIDCSIVSPHMIKCQMKHHPGAEEESAKEELGVE